MNKRIVWLIGLLLVFSASLIIAEEFQTTNPNQFDPDDPSAFNYVTGDYSTITDWTKVDWTQIPAQRINEVPKENLDYNQINLEQRKAMNTEQLWHHIDKIEDLSKDVDPETAKEAIKEQTGIEVNDFGQGARVEAGVLKSTQGKKDQLVMEQKSGWMVTINNEGEVIVSGSKKEVIDENGEITSETIPLDETSISSKDSFKINGANLKLKDGRVVSEINGLNCEDGEYFVQNGEMATLNQLEIKDANPQIDPLDELIDLESQNINSNEDKIKIYFEDPLELGTAHNGDYVVLTEEEIFISGESYNGVLVTPKPGNLFFNMVKKEYINIQKEGDFYIIADGQFTLVPDQRDDLSIRASKGAKISFKDRKEQGLTPLMNIDEEGDLIIDTGRIHLNYDSKKDKWSYESSKIISNQNSVPFEVEMYSNDENKHLLISSSNRMAVINPNDDNSISVLNSRGLKVTNNLEFNSIKTIYDLIYMYPEKAFLHIPDDLNNLMNLDLDQTSDPYKTPSANECQFVVEISEKYPHKMDKVEQIIFDKKKLAAYLPGTSVIVLGEKLMIKDDVRELSTPGEGFIHEVNHLIVGTVKEKEKEQGFSDDEGRIDKIHENIAKEGIGELEKAPGMQKYIEWLQKKEEERVALINNKGIHEITPKVFSMNDALMSLTADTDRKITETLISNNEDAHQTKLERIDKNKESITRLENDLKNFETSGLIGSQEEWQEILTEEKTRMKKDELELVKLEQKREKLAQQKKVVSKAKKAVEKVIPLKGGSYAFKEYKREEGKYSELGTIPLEVPPERAAESIQQGNEVLRKLTQVAYDIDQIDESEYNQRMGHYCDINPCGKCLVYQLTCEK